MDKIITDRHLRFHEIFYIKLFFQRLYLPETSQICRTSCFKWNILLKVEAETVLVPFVTIFIFSGRKSRI